jgi:ABC-2 type transport system permease protein
VVNFLGIAVCAVVVGWRPHNGFWAAVAAFALLFLFRYAVAWLGVLLGLMFKSEETADHAVPLVFPVAMIANTFVPTDGMPEWLRVIADWNPLSALTNACRQLWGNPGLPHSGNIALPLQNPILATLIWSVGIIALAAPVAVWRYRNAGLR